MALNPKLPRAPGKMNEDARNDETLESQNESVSPLERSGKSLSELSSGPKIGDNGAYLPAKYAQVITVQTVTGPVSRKLTIEDR